jgi:hypothetical protein
VGVCGVCRVCVCLAEQGREGKKFSSLTGGAGAISRSDAEAAALALTAAANSAMPAAELLSRGTVQLIHKVSARRRLALLYGRN